MVRALFFYVCVITLVPVVAIFLGINAPDFFDLLNTHGALGKSRWFDACSLVNILEERSPRLLCSLYLSSKAAGYIGVSLAVVAVLQTVFLFSGAIWIRRDPLRLSRSFGWIANLFVAVWSIAVVPRFLAAVAIILAICVRISLDRTGDKAPLIFLALAGIFAVVVFLSQIGTAIRYWRGPMPGRSLGYAVTRDEAPALYGFVGKVAREAGVESPDSIVVTVEPDFSVTDAPVRVSNAAEPLTGGVMVLSLPLLRLLTADEAACIIAHELGHLADPASKVRSNWQIPYTALVAELETFNISWHSPTKWHLGLVPALFQGAVAETLRREEAHADRAALRVARPETAVAALFKVVVAQEALEIHANINFDRLDKGAVLDNLSTEAVDLTLKVLTTVDPPRLVERVRRMEMEHAEGPSIEQRIGNFGYSLDDAAALLKSHPHQGEPPPVGDLTHLEERATRNVHRFQQVLAGEPGPLSQEEVDSMEAFLDG